LRVHLDGSAYGERFHVDNLLVLSDAYVNGRRKCGVENQGLCRLIASTNDILQHESGWKPHLDHAPPAARFSSDFFLDTPANAT
jgi:hypothetical protein